MIIFSTGRLIGKSILFPSLGGPFAGSRPHKRYKWMNRYHFVFLALYALIEDSSAWPYHRWLENALTEAIS